MSGNNLTATSAGTCLVTVTKSGDPTYLAASSDPTPVAMAMPAKPRPLTVEFVENSSALTAVAKKEISALHKQLVSGAFVILTGCAKGNAKLGFSRAVAVQGWRAKSPAVNMRLRINDGAALNAVTIVTVRQ